MNVCRAPFVPRQIAIVSIFTRRRVAIRCSRSNNASNLRRIDFLKRPAARTTEFMTQRSTKAPNWGLARSDRRRFRRAAMSDRNESREQPALSSWPRPAEYCDQPGAPKWAQGGRRRRNPSALKHSPKHNGQKGGIPFQFLWNKTIVSEVNAGNHRLGCVSGGGLEDSIAFHMQISPPTVAIQQPNVSKFRDVLGPGLITGASGDDPSGIATYSQAGSQFPAGRQHDQSELDLHNDPSRASSSQRRPVLLSGQSPRNGRLGPCSLKLAARDSAVLSRRLKFPGAPS